MPKVNFTLNGQAASVTYESGMHFLEVLREECGIISPKNGCAPEGACGCCAILVDGQPVLACLRKPEHMEGRDVVTMEGMPEEMRRVLGEAFVHEGGIQCGFCIPGILVRASSLLRNNRSGDREAVAKSLDSHLCRCTGYARIIDAVQTAGEMWNDGKQIPRPEPRRHSYFGEEFGLSRATQPNGVSQERYRPIHFALSRAGPGPRGKAFRRRHARSRNVAWRCRLERTSAR